MAGKLGAAVIGMNVGQHHALGYWESPDVELKAVCALTPKKLEAFRERVPVEVYTDMDALLARDDIQIVSVCTPDYTHREVATKVLRAGKHMLLEKAMSLTMGDAEAVCQEAERAGTICSMGYEFRVNPVMHRLKALLDGGDLGEFKAVSMYYWRGPFRYSKSTRWIQRSEFSGGMLVAEACHWFDLLRWFGGEVANLDCTATGQILPETNFEDVAYVNLRFASGAVGQMSHVLAGFGTALLVWVFGTKASAWGYVKPMESEDPFLGLGWPGEYGRVAVVPGHPHQDAERARLLAGVRVQTFGLESLETENIRDYAKLYAACVARGEQPPVTLEDGLRSLELSLAARASSLNDGIRVSLPLDAGLEGQATRGFLREGALERERRAHAQP